jgi:pimeloyl-ACP methyl ester carboxylesterase
MSDITCQQLEVNLGLGPVEVMRLTPSTSNNNLTVVLLHEGLGSIAQWQSFPHQLATTLACEVICYSRYGYGNSSAASIPRPVSFMHGEATLVPELLRQLHLNNPVILCGHSDGASISLLAAAQLQLAGVIVLAPHLFVEDVTVTGIAAARDAYAAGKLKAGLGKYHADVEHTFTSWRDVWLSDDFRSWNIEADISSIKAPLLAIQGHQDQYGTMAQLASLQTIVPQTQLVKLDQCGHAPHLEQPQATLEAIQQFLLSCATEQ